MAKFTLNIEVDDNYTGTYPDLLTVEIDENLARRILEFQEAVKRLGAYRITEFNNAPAEWFETDSNDTDQTIKDPDWKIDAVTMHVTDRSVIWQAYVKGTNTLLESNLLSIKRELLPEFPNLKKED